MNKYHAIFALLLLTGLTAQSDNIAAASKLNSSVIKMTPELEFKCRQTQQFKKMCKLCQADKVGKSPTCLADVPNHGSSPEFMRLVHAMGDMVKACGYEVPASSCIRGLRGRLAAICRNEEKIPDIGLLVEAGNCN